ncbi:MFS transporter [Streptomyces minutiscleroticus]|uniref:MFS transporter n=1 Tax=Streptomyces minutiscleroticus TaxID=68238 RepID=UPI00332A4147
MAGTAASPPAATSLVRYLSVAVPARLAAEGARVGLVLLAVEREHDAGLGGLLVAALMIPNVVAAPLAGALADRARRRRLFQGLGLAVYGIGLAVAAYALGRVPLAWVLVLVAAAGCCAPLITGGLTSLLAELVPKEVLGRAFSIDSTTYNLAGICGPALATALAAAIGPGGAVSALGAASVLGGLAVALLRLPARSPSDHRPQALRPAVLAAGAREVLVNPPLRSVTWSSSIGQAGVGALPVITALLAAEHQAHWMTGGLMTAFAVGALAGSLTYAVKPWSRSRPERVVLLCLLLTAPPLALAAGASGVLLTTALFAVAGWCTGPLFSALLAARERYAPARLRTQIFTLGAGLKSTAAAAGAAAVGAASHLGPAPLLLITAFLQVAAALVGNVLLRRRAGSPSPLTGPPRHRPVPAAQDKD